jgi:hypothetical protein
VDRRIQTRRRSGKLTVRAVRRKAREKARRKGMVKEIKVKGKARESTEESVILQEPQLRQPLPRQLTARIEEVNSQRVLVDLTAGLTYG